MRIQIEFTIYRDEQGNLPLKPILDKIVREVEQGDIMAERGPIQDPAGNIIGHFHITPN